MIDTAQEVIRLLFLLLLLLVVDDISRYCREIPLSLNSALMLLDIPLTFDGEYFPSPYKNIQLLDTEDQRRDEHETG